MELSKHIKGAFNGNKEKLLKAMIDISEKRLGKITATFAVFYSPYFCNEAEMLSQARNDQTAKLKVK